MIEKDMPYHNIHQLARDVRSGEVTLGGSYETIDELKPEMYAITAVLVDRVAERALTNMPEVTDDGWIAKDFWEGKKENPWKALDLLMDIRPVSLYEIFRYNLSSALQFFVREEIAGLDQMLEDGVQDPVVPYYKRYRELLGIMEEGKMRGDLKHEKNYLLPDGFITAGTNTAAKVMTNLLEVISWVYQRDTGQIVESDEYRLIAENSYPFLIYLANASNVVSSKLRHDFQRSNDIAGVWSSKDFFLQETNHGLKIGTDISENIDDIPMEQREVIDTIRSGCPALVNFGDGSAIRKLWTYCIGVGIRLHEKEVSRLFIDKN